MASVPLAEAETKLGELIDRVEAGESIAITRQGKAVAHLVRQPFGRAAIAPDFFDELDRIATPQRQDSGSFMRELREEDRF